MSSSNCCFLTCIQVFQEAGQVVWDSHQMVKTRSSSVSAPKGSGPLNRHRELDLAPVLETPTWAWVHLADPTCGATAGLWPTWGRRSKRPGSSTPCAPNTGTRGGPDDPHPEAPAACRASPPGLSPLWPVAGEAAGEAKGSPGDCPRGASPSPVALLTAVATPALPGGPEPHCMRDRSPGPRVHSPLSVRALAVLPLRGGEGEDGRVCCLHLRSPARCLTVPSDAADTLALPSWRNGQSTVLNRLGTGHSSSMRTEPGKKTATGRQSINWDRPFGRLKFVATQYLYVNDPKCYKCWFGGLQTNRVSKQICKTESANNKYQP